MAFTLSWVSDIARNLMECGSDKFPIEHLSFRDRHKLSVRDGDIPIAPKMTMHHWLIVNVFEVLVDVVGCFV